MVTNRNRIARFVTGALLATGFIHISSNNVHAVATTIYADSSTGSDSTGNGTAANPFQTFHKAYTAAVSGDTINLTGTFTWTNAGETGDAVGTGYTLAKNLTIQGQSRSTIVQAAATRNSSDRMVFFIAAGATVTMRHLTIRHGRVNAQGQGGGITLYGVYCGTSGACPGTTGTLTLDQVDVVKNDATTALNTYTYDRAGGVMMQENANLTVLSSNIEDNNCICKYYAAGGIYAGMQSGTVTISNSSVSLNTVNSDGGSTYAYDYTAVAGGFASQRFSKVTITNSTFYGNTTNSYAGAMSLYYTDRGARLTNVTVVGNSASLGAGGILWNQMYTGTNYDLRMKNVLLADNTGVGGASNDFYAKDSLSGNAVIASHSIIESSTNSTITGTGIVTGNQTSLDLDTAIATNGASTETHTLALGASSTAVNAGDSAAHGYTGNTVTPPATDQRGSARVGAYDIGAYEYGSTPPTTSTTTTSTTSTTTSSTTSSTTTTTAPTTSSSTSSSSTSSSTTSSVVTTPSSSSSSTSSSVVATSSTVAGNSTTNSSSTVVAPSSTDAVTINTVAEVTATTIPPLSSNTGDVLAMGRAPETTVAPSTSTTTTTTTVVANNGQEAPDAPTASLGEATAMVDGQAVTTSITRENNTLVITFGAIQVVVAAVDANGDVQPLDAEGNIRLSSTRQLLVSMKNLSSSGEVELWLFSTPTLLGTFTPDKDGALRSNVKVGTEIPDGIHRLVLKQATKTGAATVMSLGIAIGDSKSDNWSIGWIVYPPLALAAILALVLPARRRRRRQAIAN